MLITGLMALLHHLFTGNDYYYDSGSDDQPLFTVFYTDPLWEGKDTYVLDDTTSIVGRT